MSAVLNENIDTVKLLLEKGADTKLKNTSGKTALDIAKLPAIIELLKAAKS